MIGKDYFVYVLSSGRNGTLYVGFTGDLAGRVQQHREGMVSGFTSRYAVTRLVWYERHDDPEAGIAREKRIKRWRRDWKLALIEADNPQWRDLFDDLFRP